MPVTWSLTHHSSATTQTLAEWGIVSAVLVRRSLAADELRLVLDADADAATGWSFRDAFTLIRDDSGAVNYFVGKLASAFSQARGEGEGISAVLKGPWWDLENIVFQQAYAVLDSGSMSDPPVQTKYLSRLTLGQNSSGSNITTGAQIEEILDWANGCSGALPKKVTSAVQTGFHPRQTEVTSVTCADAIRMMARWHPDAVGWFDYENGSAASGVGFYFQPRSALAAVELAMDTNNAGIAITPRNDLTVPAVGIHYRREDSKDGKIYVDYSDDIYPAMASLQQIGALVAEVPLRGTSSVRQRQRLGTRAFPEAADTDADKLEWLCTKVYRDTLKASYDAGNLRLVADSWDASIVDLQIDTGDEEDRKELELATDIADVTKEVVEGTLQPWMSGKWAPVTVKVELQWIGAALSAEGKRFFGEDRRRFMTHRFNATDLGSGVFYGKASVELGETPPSGIAQAIYNTLSFVHYEGSFQLSEAECGTTSRTWVGKKLNLTDGLTAWETMAAVIVESAEDIFAGETRIAFGPPGFLGPGDFRELMRAEKENKVTYRTTEERTEAEPPLGDEGEVAGAHHGAKMGPENEKREFKLMNSARILGDATNGWEVLYTQGYVAGWGGPTAAHLDTIISGMTTAVTVTADREFVAKLTWTLAEDEPQWQLDGAAFENYASGAVPADSIDEEGGTATTYFPLGKVAFTDGVPDWELGPPGGFITPCLPSAVPAADSGGGSAGASSSSAKPAIVPSRFSSVGFTEMLCVEAPQAVFVDFVEIAISDGHGVAKLEDHWHDIAAPGTLQVWACHVDSQDKTVSSGVAWIEAGLFVKCYSPAVERGVARVIVAGRRFGHPDRFAERTEEEFEANERFLRMRHPEGSAKRSPLAAAQSRKPEAQDSGIAAAKAERLAESRLAGERDAMLAPLESFRKSSTAGDKIDLSAMTPAEIERSLAVARALMKPKK